TRAEGQLLRSALSDASPAVRRYAVTSLGTLGSEAADSVAGLLSLFNREKSAELRRQVLAALVKIEPKGRGVIEGCIKALEDPDAGVCRQATAALVEAGPESRAAVAALLRALDHADAEVARVADGALARALLDKTHVSALAAALAQASGMAAR